MLLMMGWNYEEESDGRCLLKRKNIGPPPHPRHNKKSFLMQFLIGTLTCPLSTTASPPPSSSIHVYTVFSLHLVDILHTKLHSIKVRSLNFPMNPTLVFRLIDLSGITS